MGYDMRVKGTSSLPLLRRIFKRYHRSSSVPHTTVPRLCRTLVDSTQASPQVPLHQLGLTQETTWHHLHPRSQQLYQRRQPLQEPLSNKLQILGVTNFKRTMAQVRQRFEFDVPSRIIYCIYLQQS